MHFIRLLLLGFLAFSGLASGADFGLRITDVGHASATLPRVAVVDTPGVAREGFLFWEQSLEAAGLDVWRVHFASWVDSPEKISVALGQLDVLWADTPYFAVAHGYGARLVAEADLKAQKMVLVGAPLGPQLAPTVAAVAGAASGSIVQEGLPWPADEMGGILGELPQEPLALPLAQAYVDWGHATAAPDPTAPVLILASGGDVVGPPECNRLPSLAWTERQFFRVDSFSFSEATHGELLRHPQVLRRMIYFLEAP
jgi:alpha-beta hydrolase superfamily lysophospholipase